MSISVSQICDALGRREIAHRLNVGRTAISNASRDELFPASYFLVIEAMCSEAGLECPRSLFSFKSDAEKDAAA